MNEMKCWNSWFLSISLSHFNIFANKTLQHRKLYILISKFAFVYRELKNLKTLVRQIDLYIVSAFKHA